MPNKNNIINFSLDITESEYDLDMVRKINIGLKDYIHYYFGTRFRIDFPDGDWIEDDLKSLMGLEGFICGENKGSNKTGIHDKDWYECEIFKDNLTFKFILTHPCNLTKQQNIEYRKLCYPVKGLLKKKEIIRFADTPYSMHYMFKNGIDAFDLIEKGLAIDKKTYIY